MGKFDRYLLSQLMMLFGFFSLVLVMVYWINRAVVLFDQLIANGQSAMVFLEFTALTLPNVIRLVLPMAAFAAVVYCANRMTSESELVVVQATGYSPFRLARPVLIFGIIVGLMLSVLTHFLVPASLNQLSQRQLEIGENFTARFLREGDFLHPTPGVTFYIRDISPDGELLDIFLSDRRTKGRQTNYTARRALFVRDEGGPMLIMYNGMSQILNLETNRLATTSFDNFVFSVGTILKATSARSVHPKEMSTAQLLWPTEASAKAARSSVAIMQQYGHERFSQALLCIVASLVGFAALLMGGFSRFGLWRQIMIAVFILVVVKSIDNFANDLARENQGNWPVIYVASGVGLLLAYAMLWISARPSLFSRRRRGAMA